MNERKMVDKIRMEEIDISENLHRKGRKFLLVERKESKIIKVQRMVITVHIRSRGGQYCPLRLLAGSPGKTRRASHLNLSNFSLICIYFDFKAKNFNVNPGRLAERGFKSAG